MTPSQRTELRQTLAASLRPPPKLALDAWVEEHIRLPSDVAATSGRLRLWGPQRDIIAAMGDPTIEFVTVKKSARVGYSTLLTGLIGNHVKNDPATILVVLPADADSKHFVVSNLEPTFNASPALRRALTEDPSGRDTMLSRRFAGGSLTVVSARSPRNLRARTARIVILDEIDAYQPTAEGDAVKLAITRSHTYADRKIVCGSTPVDEETSAICRMYEQSDKREFQVECPHCAARAPILWKNIRWPEGEPEKAYWACTDCGGIVEERQKGALVGSGQWIATAPQVTGHAGFAVNALSSLLPNAAWGRLAKEFLEAKKSPETLKVFVNVVLGEPWRDDSEGAEAGDISSRAEPFSLDAVPPEVISLTAGVDVQGDRLEMTTLGWTADGAMFALGHEICWGSPLQPGVWEELDHLLSRTVAHPNGGRLRIDAAFIDSGDGNATDAVYAFCRPRTARRVFATKGIAGFGRPAVELSPMKHVRLWVCAVDVLKAQLLDKLTGGGISVRFSDSLPGEWFLQLTSERRVVRFSKGVPVKQFERISGRRAEALDCTIYGMAAHLTTRVDPQRRAAELATPAAPKPSAPTVIRSAWLGR